MIYGRRAISRFRYPHAASRRSSFSIFSRARPARYARARKTARNGAARSNEDEKGRRSRRSESRQWKTMGSFLFTDDDDRFVAGDL